MRVFLVLFLASSPILGLWSSNHVTSERSNCIAERSSVCATAKITHRHLDVLCQVTDDFGPY